MEEGIEGTMLLHEKGTVICIIFAKYCTFWTENTGLKMCCTAVLVVVFQNVVYTVKHSL
jgi:hypothetical protein